MADFQSWSRENLAQLASDLLAQNTQLQKDLKTVRDAWRAVVIKSDQKQHGDFSHDNTNPSAAGGQAID